jgi:hypothetical protein
LDWIGVAHIKIKSAMDFINTVRNVLYFF